MKIIKCVAEEVSVNSYIIEENNKSIVIDPYSLLTIEKMLETKIIDYIIITHEHFDHIRDVDRVREKYGAKLLCQINASKNIQSSRKNMSKFSAILLGYMGSDVIIDPFEIKEADIIFDEHYTLKWQNKIIELYHAPGHSNGGIIIKLDNNLFVGDNLFAEVDTNINGLSKDREKYQKITWNLLKSFDKNMTVYPGHYKVFQLKDRTKE